MNPNTPVFKVKEYAETNFDPIFLPKQVPNPLEWPRISIVTPSYNQGQFIEETIRSVLLQGYPNLEYIIIDGGSTDNSVEIIKKYEKYLTYWVSEPDQGQSHAINKGFQRCTGEIMAWLNSDDFYLPHALEDIAKIFISRDDIDLVTGAWLSYDNETENLVMTRACGTGISPNISVMLSKDAHLGQHSTFWRSKVWQTVGTLREDLHYAMDHEFFLRCCDLHLKFKLTSKPLAAFRRYLEQKTGNWDKYATESQKIISEYKAKHSEWNIFWGKIKIYFAKLLWSLSSHRNIHPRLGLKPKFDEQLVRSWLEALNSKN